MKISPLTSFMCFAALAVGVMATGDQTQVTSASPSTGSPVPTTVKVSPTPAPTAGKTVATPAPSTPAPTAGKAASTSSPTTPAKLPCFNISVEGDATYCIPGSVCSGSGKAPAGVNCPKKGDVAIESCLNTLKSYGDDAKCVAPVDAECKVVKTGVWGCVWKGAEPIGAPPGKAPATPAPTTGKSASSPAPAPAKTAPATAANAITPAPTTAKTATPALTTGNKNESTPALTNKTQKPVQPREQAKQHSEKHSKDGKAVACLQI